MESKIIHGQALKVYLSGTLKHPWRKKLQAEVVEEIGVSQMSSPLVMIHPRLPGSSSGMNRTHPDHARPEIFMPANIAGLKRADILFAYLRKGASGIGTAWELGFAYALGKPIILCNTSGNAKFDFLQYPCTSRVSDWNTAVRALAFALSNEVPSLPTTLLD